MSPDRHAHMHDAAGRTPGQGRPGRSPKRSVRESRPKRDAHIETSENRTGAQPMNFSKGPQGHILKRFDKDMRKLQKRVLKMGGMVVEQMERLQDALGQEDEEQARQVIEGDRPIDLQEVKADKFIVNLLARRSPVGSDLRYIVAASRIVTELERLGDETAQVARVLFQERYSLGGCEGGTADEEIRRLLGQLIGLLEKALDAFEDYDYQGALALARSDDSPRAELDKRLKHLMEWVFENQQQVAEAVNFVLVLRALERSVRHVQNIAEHTIYLITGEDIRHR
ncbi:MAG TPA: phosphate signaling complex protein PhoU [Chromatiales bacterium]|nr:phosphate signaling complex protein PhoU [Chromatiales bacterium]